MSKKINPPEKSSKQAEMDLMNLFGAIYVGLIRDLQKKYAKDEIFKFAWKSFDKHVRNYFKKATKDIKTKSFKNYIDVFEGGLWQNHEFEKEILSDKKYRYKISKCPWHEMLKANNAESDIGDYFCYIDEKLAKDFSKEVKMDAKDFLMHGKPFCDFLINKKE